MDQKIPACNKSASGYFTKFSPEEAFTCKDALEQATKKPFHVEVQYTAGTPPDYRNYWIVSDGSVPECATDVVYDSRWPTNQDYAKQCAATLSNLTGTPHEATIIKKRVELQDIYKVTKKK